MCVLVISQVDETVPRFPDSDGMLSAAPQEAVVEAGEVRLLELV